MKVKTCRTATDTCSRKPIMLLLWPLKGSNRNQTKMLLLVNRTNHFQQTKLVQVTSITSFRYLVPPTEGEGRNIVLVRILVGHCLHSISWTNQWSSTKLAHTHYWERGNKSLDFGDIDLIFKVIPALWNFQILTKKGCLHPISRNKWWILTKIHIYIVKLVWFKDLSRFWWPWLNFQGHHTIKL